MTTALVAAGLLLVALSIVDVAWTTIAAGSGAGPITARLGRRLWALALAAHRRRRSDVVLTVAGVMVVFAVLGTWIVLALAGWALVFASAEGAVRVTTTGVPADLGGRLYFTGYSVFTLGNGDMRPGEGLWQLATVLATGTGLILVTLAITYLVPVASAVAVRRQLAGYISSLGTTPHEIVLRGWNGAGFGSLTQHLVMLTPLVHTTRQQHLTYPVLHYFHSQQVDSAAAPNMANLSQAVTLLRSGVSVDVAPDGAALAALEAAIEAFLDTVSSAYVAQAAPPLPLPSLDPLREVGIPVVDQGAYEAAAPVSERRRALLTGLLADDGWDPGTA